MTEKIIEEMKNEAKVKDKTEEVKEQKVETKQEQKVKEEKKKKEFEIVNAKDL